MFDSGTPVAGMLVTVGANTDQATKGLNSVSQQLNSVASGGNTAASGLNSAMGLASAAIVGIGVASVKSAMTFEQQMRNVNSIAQLPEESFQALQDQVIDFALTTRSSSEDVAKSLYQVASAGLSLDETLGSVTVNGKQMSEAMAVMQASSRAAGAGLADADEVSRLIIATMRAYGDGAEEAGHITDVFLKTVQTGLTTLPELASGLGRIIPIAANLGVSVEELGYAMSTMTQTGLSTDEAVTRLNGVFTQFLKPSKDLQGVIEKLGYSSGTALIEGLGGVIPAVKAVTETVFESTESIGGMTKAQTKQALQMPLLTDQMSIYQQELAKIIEKDGEGSLAAQKKQLAIDKLTKKMEEYSASLAGVTPEQERLVKEFYGTNEGIAGLFNNVRAIGGVMALTADETASSADAFNAWSESVNGSVEAARAEQYKSLETQVRRLKVAFNVLGLEIGLTLIPPLTTLLDTLLIPLIRSVLPPLRSGLEKVSGAFEKLPKSVQALVTVFGGLAVTLKGAGFALAPLMRVLGLNVAKFGALAGPLGLVAAGIGAFGAAYTKNLFGIKDATDQVIENGSNFVRYMQGVITDGDTLNDWLTHLPDAWQGVALAVGTFVDSFRDAWVQFGEVVSENIGPAWQSIVDFFTKGTIDFTAIQNIFSGLETAIRNSFGLLVDNIVAWVKESAPGLENSFFLWAKSAIAWIGNILSLALPLLADMLGGIVQWILGTGVPTVLGAGVALVEGIISGFGKGGEVSKFVNALMPNVLGAVAKVQEAAGTAGAILAEKVHAGFQEGLTKAFGEEKAGEIMAGIETALGQLEGVFKPTFDRIGESLKGFGDDMKATVGPALDRLKSALEGLAGPASIIGKLVAVVGVVVGKVFGELFGQLVSRLPEIFAAVIDLLSGAITAIGNVITGASQMLSALFSGDWAGAFEAGKGIVGEFVGFVGLELVSLLRVVDQIFGGIYDAIVNTINDLTGATLPSWDALKNGIIEKFNEIKASITDTTGEIGAKFDQVVATLQPAIDTIKGVFQDIKDGVAEFLDELGPINEQLAPIKESLDRAFGSFAELLVALQPPMKWLADALLKVAGFILVVMGSAVVAALSTFGSVLKAVFENGALIIGGFGSIIAGVFDVISGILTGFVGFVKGLFAGDLQAANEEGIKSFNLLKEGIGKIFEGIGNIIVGAFGTIYDAVVNIANKIPGVALKPWEEVSKGFEFGRDKIAETTTDVSTMIAGMSTDLATGLTSNSTQMANDLTSVASDVTGQVSGLTSSVSTSFMEGNAAATNYSGQMKSALEEIGIAAGSANLETSALVTQLSSSINSAAGETESATGGLVDGILSKINGIKDQATGPQELFSQISSDVNTSSSAIQGDLDGLLAGWETTFAQMSTTPGVSLQGATDAMQTNISDMTTTVTSGLAELETGYATSFSNIQVANEEFQTTSTASMADFSAAQVSAWMAMSEGVGVTATTMTTNVQTTFADFRITLTDLLALILREVSLSFDSLFLTVDRVMSSMKESMVSAWQAMLGGTRAQLTEMRSEVNSQMSGMVSDLRGYAGQMMGVGASIGQGLANGIRSAIGAAIDAAVALVQAAIAAAWAAAAAASPSRIMMQLGEFFGAGFVIGVEGQGDAAAATSARLIEGAIDSAKDMAQIRSPSRAMFGVGWDFITGLVEGMGDAEKDALAKVAEIVDKIMGTVSNIVRALNDLSGFRPRPIDLSGFTEQVKEVVAGFKVLAEFFAENHQLDSAKAVLDPLGDIFSKLSSVMTGVGNLFGDAMAGANIEGARQIVGTIIDIAKLLVESLARAAADLENEAWPKAVALASVAGNIIENIGKMSEVVSSMASQVPPESDIDALTQFAVSLVMGFAKVGETVDREASDAATGFAGLVSVVVEPVSAAIKAIKDLMTVSDTQAQIAMGHAEAVAAAVMGLGDALASAADNLSPSDIQKIATAAAVFESITKPWKNAIEAVDAIAGHIFAPIGQIANNIIGPIEGLAYKLSKVPDFIGRELLPAAREGAAIMEEMVTPWEKAVKTLDAIAGHVFSPIGSIANKIVGAVEGLAYKLSKMTDFIGQDLVPKAREGALLMADVMEPWEKAVKTLEAIAAFVFVPIGAIANNIVGPVEGLAYKLSKMVDFIGRDLIPKAREGAALMADITDPWEKAISALTAVAAYLFAPVVDAANQITSAIVYLAERLAGIADTLGPRVILMAAAGADAMLSIAEPWKDAVDALVAVAGYIGRDIQSAATSITAGMVVLAKALISLADSVGLDTLEKAQKVALLLSDVLEPWEKAIKIAVDMKAFIVMPDFVDKMIRFGRQWALIIEELGKIVKELSAEGLDAVERFANVLTSLVTGLREAADLLVAGSWPDPDPQVWDSFVNWTWGVFQFFYDKVQELLSNPANIIGFDPVSEFAGTLESLMNALGAAVELIRNFEFTAPDPELFMAFQNWVWGVFQFFYDKVQELINDPSNVIGFDPVSSFASALEAIMGALTTALDLVRNFDFVLPDPEIWAVFVNWVWGVFQFFYAKVQDLVTDPANVIGFDPVEAFGSALESVLGALSAGLEVARNFEFAEPPTEQWNNFVTWVWGVFQTFYSLVQDLVNDPNNIIDFAPVDSFGAALSSIMGGLDAAVTLITNFSFTAPNGDEWGAFIDWVILTFTTLRDYVQTMVTDPETALNFDPEESFGNALGAIMGGLSATLDLITNFIWVPPDPLIWDNFIQWVIGFMHDLRDLILLNFPDSAANAATFDPVAAFGDAISAVMGGLQAALEFLSGLAGFIPPSETLVNTFLENVLYLFGLIITYTDTNLTPRQALAVSRFSTALSDLTTGLSGALDLFDGMASLDDRTIDWIANAGAGTGTNTGDAMQIIGYLFQAIVQTLERFHTEVISQSGTSWTPAAQAFYDAINSVIGLLSSALALFTDLGTSGMPSTTEIQAFVDAIMGVFTTFNTGLTSVLTPLAATITSIQTELSTNLAGWLNFNAAPLVGRMFYDSAALISSTIQTAFTNNPLTVAAEELRQQVVSAIHGYFSYHAASIPGRLFYEDGRNVVLSLGAGMLSEQAYIYQVAYDIGQSVIAGLNASLNIASPSKVAMHAGEFVSVGLGLGMLSEKQAAVDAAAEVADAVVAELESKRDRPNFFWPDLSGSPQTLGVTQVVEHRVSISVEGGDALPKMNDFEMSQFARDLARYIKDGG